MALPRNHRSIQSATVLPPAQYSSEEDISMTETTKKMVVKIDQSVCVGGGLCVLSSPEVFDQRDEDGVVVLRMDRPSPDQYEAVESAVRKCPSRAIKVEFED